MPSRYLASFLGSPPLQAAAVSADSTRGAQVFELQGCAQCHALNGVGPGASETGPDLGRIADRGFTPASLAATMWNHAPAMWVETNCAASPDPPWMNSRPPISSRSSTPCAFSRSQATRRAARLSSPRKNAPSATASTNLAKPRNVKPVSRMDGRVRSAANLSKPCGTIPPPCATRWRASNIRLPQLTGQDLADLLVYTRRAAGTPRRHARLPPGCGGCRQTLFESKRCTACHGPLTHFLSTDVRDETLTDIAADMWNHGLDMSLRNTTFAPGEMRADRRIYLVLPRPIEGAGEVGRGAQVFTAKKCAVCHDDPASGAPSLPGLTANGKYFSGATMVSSLTRHGPAMLDKMREKHLAWPHFSGRGDVQPDRLPEYAESAQWPIISATRAAPFSRF